MDWTQILITLLTSTTLLGLISFIFYRKENKKLKQQEVQNASVETQSKEIDLGKKYVEESVNIVKGIKSLLETNNADTAAIVAKLSIVENRLTDVEKKLSTYNRSIVSYNKRLGIIERFLDGNLEEFAKQEEEAKRAKHPEPKKVLA